MEPINASRGTILSMDTGATRSFREPSVLLDVKRWVQDKLIEEIGNKADTKERFSDEHLRNDIRKAFETVVEEHRIIFSSKSFAKIYHQSLITLILARVWGALQLQVLNFLTLLFMLLKRVQ